MTQNNPSVTGLMMLLKERHSDLLEKQLPAADDHKTRDAILTEAREVLHRINLAQNLMFVEVSKKLGDAVDAVRAADDKLKDELEQIANLKAFINAFTKFLGFVDKALDVAKVIALI
jgi:hypothetical protein